MSRLCFISPPEPELQNWKDGKDGPRYEYKYQKTQHEILMFFLNLKKDGWIIGFDDTIPLTISSPEGTQLTAFYINQDFLNDSSVYDI